MNLMLSRPLRFLAPLFLCVAATQPVFADLITVTYAGTIASGTTGGGTPFCYFAVCGDSLTGDNYNLVFHFDTSVGLYQFGGALLDGGSVIGQPSVGSATLTINGFSVTLDGILESEDSAGCSPTQIVQQGPQNYFDVVANPACETNPFPALITTAFTYSDITLGTTDLFSFELVHRTGDPSTTYAALGRFGVSTMTVSSISSAPEPRSALLIIMGAPLFLAALRFASIKH